MKYTLYENLSSYRGVISNTHGFLNRRLDTGFDTKWTGYWTPPTKILDYYSIRINGIYLNSDTLKATEYSDQIIHHHETDTLQIKEKINFPEQKTGFNIELEIKNESDDVKAVQTAVELGVDIRNKSDDIGPEDYEIKEKDSQIKISNSASWLKISSEHELDRKGENRMKTHYPGEKQRCFIPGEIILREEVEGRSSKEITLNLRTPGEKTERFETRDQDLDHELGRTFKNSIKSIENLTYDSNGPGIIAGHPWFQSYWARDTFWTLLGLIDAGYFELSRKILENFAEKNVPGKIQLDENREENLDRADTEPLFIIAADKLRRHSHINSKIETAMEEAMQELQLQDKVVQHSPKATWMDTQKRETAVEIQSLWLEAAKITGSEKKEDLRDGLEKFTEEEHILDNLETGEKTVNPAVPLMLGQFEEEIAKKELEVLNGEFSTRYGSRTKALSDPGYNPEGYHTGSSWPLVTGWTAAANLQYGNYRHGKNLLEKTTRLLDRNQPGALPEVVNSETGDLLGCPEQAWSAGLYVHVVDTYLLGIKVEEDKVTVNPAPKITATRKGKKVRDEEIDLHIDKGEVEILNDPDLNIEIKTGEDER